MARHRSVFVHLTPDCTRPFTQSACALFLSLLSLIKSIILDPRHRHRLLLLSVLTGAFALLLYSIPPTKMPKKKLTFPSISSAAGSAFFTSGHSSQLEPASHIPDTFTDGLPLPKILVFDLDYTLWPFWVDTHVSAPLKPANKDPSQNTAMLDRYGESFAFYPEVAGVLHAARAKGVAMGLASRTHAPDLAEKMLRNIIIPIPKETQTQSSSTATTTLLDDDGFDVVLPALQDQPDQKKKEKPLRAWDYFAHREIYPGSKIQHFRRIQSNTRTNSRKASTTTTTTNSSNMSEEVAFADMLFFDDEGRNREVETNLGVTFVLVRDGVTRAEVDRGVRAWRRRWGIAANGAAEGGVATAAAAREGIGGDDLDV